MTSREQNAYAASAASRKGRGRLGRTPFGRRKKRKGKEGRRKKRGKEEKKKREKEEKKKEKEERRGKKKKEREKREREKRDEVMDQIKEQLRGSYIDAASPLNSCITSEYPYGALSGNKFLIDSMLHLQRSSQRGKRSFICCHPHVSIKTKTANHVHFVHEIWKIQVKVNYCQLRLN